MAETVIGGDLIKDDSIRVADVEFAADGGLPITEGGTGAVTASTARTSLGAASDSNTVHLNGNETITGIKTFTNNTQFKVNTLDGNVRLNFLNSLDNVVRSFLRYDEEVLETTLSTNNVLRLETFGISASHVNITASGSGQIILNAGSEIINASNNTISFVRNPTAAQDAATKNYVDTQNALDVHLAGPQTITGAKTFIPLSNGPIITVRDSTDVATIFQVDTNESGILTSRATISTGGFGTGMVLGSGEISDTSPGIDILPGSGQFTFHQTNGLTVRTTALSADPKLTLDYGSEFFQASLIAQFDSGSQSIVVESPEAFAIRHTSVGSTTARFEFGTLFLTRPNLEGSNACLRITNNESNAAAYAIHIDGAGNRTIRGLGTPVDNTDATTKLYVDTADALDVHLAGAQTIAGVKTFNSPTPAVFLSSASGVIGEIGLQIGDGDQSTSMRFAGLDGNAHIGIDGTALTFVSAGGNSMQWDNELSLGGFKIVSVANPTLAQDAATKNYVDTTTVPFSDTKVSTLGTATSISTSTHVIYGVTNTAVPRTITVSSTDIAIDGRIIFVKDESGGAGTNNITIATEGPELIDGAPVLIITVNYGAARLYARGGNLFSI